MLAEDIEGSVDHDLGDLGVVEEGVDRPVAQDVGSDLVEELTAIAHRQGDALLLVDRPLQHLHHPETELGIGHLAVVESGTQLFHDLEMQTAPQFGEGVVAGSRDGRELVPSSRRYSICQRRHRLITPFGPLVDC